MGYVALAGRVLLCLVFVFSVAGKVGQRRFREFASSLVALRLVRRSAAGALARAVVVGEALVGLGLASPVPLAGLAGAALLLVVFALGIALGRRRGGNAPCRCFGSGEVPLGRRHIVRNLALAVVAAVAAVADRGFPGDIRLGGALVAAAAAGVCALIIRFLDDIIAAFAVSGDAPGRAG